MPDDLPASAMRLARAGGGEAAVALFEAAGARGDPSAMAELAAWFLRGDIVPRDLARARVALARAVAIGHVDAALLEAALTANGTGGSCDWAGAVALLRRAAASDPVAAAHAALIKAMRLDADGYPLELPIAEMLSESPYVARFANAVTPAECLHVAGVANVHLEPGVVVDPATGRAIAHPVRSSYTATIGPAQATLPIAALDRRLAVLTGTPLANAEPLQVLRYAPGQQYRLHSDALPGVTNQRGTTAIAYLNDGFSGGETEFPALSLRFRPRPGDVLVFGNVLPDGSPDVRARHAGLPVTAGVKWIATRWIRQGAYDPWAEKGHSG